MTEEEISGLSERLAQLMTEVRRQGRACIAAQAAAETCLEEVRALESAISGVETGDADDMVDDAMDDAWLLELLPVFDAMDRTEAQAARATVRAALLRRSLFPGVRRAAQDLEALSAGIRLMRRQLDGALDAIGVTVDREAGGEVEPERHCVVEVTSSFDARPRVLEVLRPGYSIRGRRIREAEVRVAMRGGPSGDDS